MEGNLSKYVKHGAPFGPTDAGLIDVTHKSVLKELFDPQNKIYNALRLNPSIIIGRRGSGKTAYLHSVFVDHEFGIVQEIRTSKTFSQIVSAIERNTPAFYLAEDISDLWQELFYFALISEVANRYRGESRELALIDDFVAKESLKAPNSVESFLWKIVRTLGAKSGQNLVGAVADVVKEVTGISFEHAKQKTIEILQKKRQRAILLLDSLEQYPTSIQSVANALSGLLMCVGQFNERNEEFNVRLCLPAELYHVFLDLVTTNPLKDLTQPNALTLHWIAGELLSVAAHRLNLYTRLYFPDRVRTPPDLTHRDQVQDFLRKFLPAQVTNKLGVSEETIAYLLRHTQLQPRHILLYLNAIFEKQRKLDRSKYPSIDESAVVTAIAETEHLLTEEVFSGYRMLYPRAKAACESCIPQLPLRFGHSTLQKVFTRRGRKPSGIADYWDFRRLLIETGIVGRVVGETDRYIVGRFEYTEPHKLVVSTEDELCLHSVFAEVFSYKKGKGKDKDTKTVYPYGSDPDGEDHRKWKFLTPEP